MSKVLLITVVWLLGVLSLGDAFASMLCKQHCEDKAFEAGEMMMGMQVVPNGEREIAVELLLQGGEEMALRSGSLWTPQSRSGDDLLLFKVYLAPKVGQFALEVRHCDACYFKEGKCHGSRRTNQVNATLVVPANHSDGPIELRALWAKSYSSGVQIAPHFTLAFTSRQTLVEL